MSGVWPGVRPDVDVEATSQGGSSIPMSVSKAEVVFPIVFPVRLGNSGLSLSRRARSENRDSEWRLASYLYGFGRKRGRSEDRGDGRSNI